MSRKKTGSSAPRAAGAQSSGYPIHGTILQLGTRKLATVHGDFLAHVFQNLSTRSHVLVVSCGDLRVRRPLLARVHSSCVTSEAYGGCDCDCAQQLDLALERIARTGRGLVFYLMQEGRGAGFAAKARDRMIVQASRDSLTTFEAYQQMGLGRDQRRYHEVASVCRLLGITAPLRLMTNNPDKVAALEQEGLPVERIVPLRHQASPFNLHYIAAKSRSGHALAHPAGDARAAELPEPVSAFEPYPLDDAPHLVHMASYLLPIRVTATRREDSKAAQGVSSAWFRVHAYFDLLTSRERTVMTHRRRDGSGDCLTPLVRVQRESILERFRLRHGTARSEWRATVREMVRHGSGCALFLSADNPGEELVASAIRRRAARACGGRDGFPVEDAALRLLARHVPGKRAIPMLAGDRRSRSARGPYERLRQHGLELLPPRHLEGRA